MSLDRLLQRVEEGVQQRLLPDLFDRAKLVHKRNWRDCPCDWCEAKRRATAYVGNAPYSLDHYGRRSWRDSAALRVRRGLAKLFDPPFEEDTK